MLSSTSPVLEDQIKISPNPSNGRIRVEIPLNQAGVNWELADIQGKILRQGIFREKFNEIVFNTLAPGIYFVKFDFEEVGVVVKKIVIE